MARGLTIPGFFNAHTHLGDAVVEEEITGGLEEVVAPPRGLKYRMLAAADASEVIMAMEEAQEQMVASGTTAFADFREGGSDGVELLRKASGKGPLRAFILGRPRNMECDTAELDATLEHCAGLGISAARDWPMDELSKVAVHVHRRRKLFALHASEGAREEIDPILDLKPYIPKGDSIPEAAIPEWVKKPKPE